MTHAGSSLNPEGSLAQPRTIEVAMSKLMILFVLFISGALYDPPRVLNHLGPTFNTIGWHVKTALQVR
jgi:hypothetical protein